jgi:hypothetical protein
MDSLVLILALGLAVILLTSIFWLWWRYAQRRVRGSHSDKKKRL